MTYRPDFVSGGRPFLRVKPFGILEIGNLDLAAAILLIHKYISCTDIAMDPSSAVEIL